MVSQCECTAQWQRINELATTTRRRGDDDTTTRRRRHDDEATTRRRRGDDDTRKTTRTQVQPQTPTINGNPSLRIREKSTWKTSRIFPKKPPQTSPISAVAWLVADQRTSLCGIVRLFGNKILLPKRAIWLATLGPQTLRGSMFWEKKECVCQKSLRDF